MTKHYVRLLAGTILAGASTPLFAQETLPAATEATEVAATAQDESAEGVKDEGEAIVVTGSRIKRTDLAGVGHLYPSSCEA